MSIELASLSLVQTYNFLVRCLRYGVPTVLDSVLSMFYEWDTDFIQRFY